MARTEIAQFFRSVLSKEMGKAVAARRMEMPWQNPTPLTIPAGTPISMPWEKQGTGTGRTEEDILPFGTGRLSYEVQPATQVPADHVFLEVVELEDGGRLIHSIQVDRLAEVFDGAVPGAPPHLAFGAKPTLHDAMQAENVKPAPGGEQADRGHGRYIAGWKAAGLIK